MSLKLTTIICLLIRVNFFALMPKVKCESEESTEICSDFQYSYEDEQPTPNNSCSLLEGKLDKFVFCCHLPQTVPDELYAKYQDDEMIAKYEHQNQSDSEDHHSQHSENSTSPTVPTVNHHKLKMCKKRQLWLDTIGMLDEHHEITVDSAMKFFEKTLANKSDWTEIFGNATTSCVATVKDFVGEFQTKLGFKKEVCSAQPVLVEACIFLNAIVACPLEAKAVNANCDIDRRELFECKDDPFTIEQAYGKFAELKIMKNSNKD